jgi:PHD/YefM family antitoxin component YafN of YafNO toxin-antitoxin module
MSAYKVLKASDVRQRWSDVVDEVARDRTRVVVEESDIPVAGVVNAKDLAWVEERDRCLAELRRAMDHIRQQLQDVPPEAFDREVARAVQEIRTGQDGTPPA